MGNVEMEPSKPEATNGISGNNDAAKNEAPIIKNGKTGNDVTIIANGSSKPGNDVAIVQNGNSKTGNEVAIVQNGNAKDPEKAETDFPLPIFQVSLQ